MIQVKDIKLNRSISTKALMSGHPVFKDGMAYLQLHGRFVQLVFEYERRGRRWLCVGCGRADHSFYRNVEFGQ